MKKLFSMRLMVSLFIVLLLSNDRARAQASFSKPNVITLKITDHFGANPNDVIDDTWAFIRAGKYISNQWDINGNILTGGAVNYNSINTYVELQIPAGNTANNKYIVGKQIDVSCAGIPLGISYSSIFGTIGGNAQIVIPKSNNGAILVNASGGSQPYQYSINGGAFHSHYITQGLASGNYSVVIKDAAGCTLTTSATVGGVTSANLNTLAITGIAVTNASCSNSDGSVTITGTGGIKPYTYQIDGIGAFQVSPTFSNLAVGNHTFIIREASGNQYTKNGTFKVEYGPVITYTTSRSSCAGTYTITAKSPLNNATDSYEYSIDGSSYQSSTVFTGLANGIHTLWARKTGTTCANSIPVNTQFVINSISTESPTCGHSYKYGLELMALSGVNQVKIVGVANTSTGNARPSIKYKDGLVIGYYNGTVPDFNREPYRIDYNYYANIGNFISGIDCSNVLIQNMDIDGNNTPPTTIYGGGLFGNEGIQLGADGIALYNTQNITISDVKAHHMTKDGLAIGDNYYELGIPTQLPPQNPQQHSSITSTRAYNTNLSMSYCNYDNNRRQGFSWTGGKNITVDYCTFNYTGKPTYNWNGGIAHGNPGAGIDIEPESWYNTAIAANIWLTCANGTFTNCDFVDNMGQAMVSDVRDRVNLMNFTNCKFHDVTGYAVWVTGKDFNFNNCKIWGGFVHGNETNGPNDGTKFTNCDFADEDISGSTFAGSYLNIETNIARKMRLNGCTTRTIHNGVRNLWMNTPGYYPESDYPLFTNCYFSNGASHTPTDNDFLTRCVFDGANTYTNLNTNVKHAISAKGLIFKGSTNNCSPNSFTLDGLQMILYDQNFDPPSDLVLGRDGSGGTDGHFDFNINAKAFLYNFWWSTINVGKNSILRTKKDGQLYVKGGGIQTENGSIIPTVINNNGKMIFESGSYSSFPGDATNPINIMGGTQSEVYFHKGANPGQLGVSPLWTHPDFGSFPIYSHVQLLQNTKFDGGHTSIPTTPTNLNTSLNEGLNFLQNTSYVKIPNSPTVYNLTTVRSIEIAFKRIGNLGQEILFYQPNGGILIVQETNILSIKIGNWVTSIPLMDNDYSCHFLTVTKRNSDNKIRIYLDGNSYPAVLPPYPSYSLMINNNQPAYLGWGDGTAGFWGWIGQVRLWSIELLEADVCYNYKRKLPLSATGLIADWDMTDGAGSVLTNRINQNPGTNGTIFSASWVTQNSIGNCYAGTAPGTNNSFNNFRPTSNNSTNSLEASNNAENLLVYPNPNNGEFEIKLNKTLSDKQELNIYSASGKLIFTKVVPVSNGIFERIRIPNSTPGIYLLKLIDGANVHIRKIIVSQ